MKRKLRRLTLLLMVLLISVMCVACGSDSTNTKSSEKSEKNDTTTNNSTWIPSDDESTSTTTNDNAGNENIENDNSENVSTQISEVNKIGNTVGNISTLGWLSKQGDWIYYNNGKGLYRIKTDGTERTYLYLNGGQYINVIGEYVIYNQAGLKTLHIDSLLSSTENSETSIDTEQEIEKLLDKPVDGVIAAGDWVYYTSGKSGREWSLYKINIDGAGKQMLCELTADSINIVDDWIYFAYGYSSSLDRKGIYKIKTDGTMQQKISSNVTDDIIVIGEYIYFYNKFSDHDEGMGLYRMKIDGTEKQRILVTTDADNTKYADGAIFATDEFLILSYKESYDCSIKLFRINCDGTGFQEIVTIRNTEEWGFPEVAVIDNYIYYKTDMGIYQMKADGTELLQLE